MNDRTVDGRITAVGRVRSVRASAFGPALCAKCGKHWAFVGSDTGQCVYCLNLATEEKRG